MDTFDTSEEVMNEVDIEETEVDFGENFEHGVNDQERENNNEQETGIGEEKEEKSIEDEKIEEKEETLSQFISANRGGSGEFKLEYEGTFVLSTLNEEQKTAQADLLTSLSANPEQAMMLPDHVEGKTTFFTAAKMNNEGNLKYEIRSFTPKEEEKEEKPIDKVEGAKLEEATFNLELNIDIDKQEDVDKETFIGQSLLIEVEAVSEVDAEQAQEITQSEKQSFNISEVQHADVEQVISVEKTQSGLTPVGKYANIDNTHYDKQVVIEAKEDTEKTITERIIDLLKDEPQADFIEEANTVIGIAETEQSLKDTQEYNTEGSTINSEPLVVVVEDKTEKVITLEDRIRELFKDKIGKPEHATMEQARIEETNIVVENNEDKNITLQKVEVSESLINEMDVSKETSVNSNQEVAKVVNTNETVEKSSIVEEVKAKEEVVEKVQSSDVVIEAVANISQEVSKTEPILSEVVNETHVAEVKEIKSESNVAEEVVVNNIQPQSIEKVEAAPHVVVDGDKNETQNIRSVSVENTRKEKKANQHKESLVVVKSEEKRVVKTKEKVVAKNQEERTPKSSREAIVLTINKSKVNNTTRSEVPISLEKPKKEQRTKEESVKAKPLNGHEILLQILGISQNATELRNAEPTNSRSAPNINQEEQETKSTKSIPSIYQQRSLNGITLKIAA